MPLIYITNPDYENFSINSKVLSVPEAIAGCMTRMANCWLHSPNGKWLTARSLFGSFQVKRTLKVKPNSQRGREVVATLSMTEWGG